MRKRVVCSTSGSAVDKSDWLDLEQLAEVAVTSEDASAPVEAAFVDDPIGWRAATPGEQTIKLFFDRPLNLRRIEVLFIEKSCERAQEFVLRWAGDTGSAQDILRQQFHFSPEGAVRELENYSVELKNVRVLELQIVPDRSGGNALATLARMRVA